MKRNILKIFKYKKIFLKKYFFIFFILIIFLILVIFKINGSSVGIYTEYLSGDFNDNSLILFEPRSIRSDEWLVNTPFVLSQYFSNFPLKSFLQGFEVKLISTMAIPAKSFKVLFHPSVWGYFFLPIENAFAFNWWFNDLLLVIFLYLFFMEITKKNLLVSVIGPLVFLFSPFLQWWRGGAISIPAFGFAILYFALKIFHYKNNCHIFINTLFLLYFSICFLFILYPPFQIPFMFCILFFLTGYLFQHRSTLKKERIVYFTFVALYMAISLLIIFKIYIHEFGDIIKIMQDTVYPGSRFVSGGNFHWLNLFNGFYNVQLLDNIKGSAMWGNQSEASNFFVLYPFILPVCLCLIFKQIKKNKIDWIFVSIILYLVITSLWLFISFPNWLAKISFLYLVPEKRMIVGIGVADLILTNYLLIKIKIKKTRTYLLFSVLLSLIAFVINIYIGWYLLTYYPLFIQNKFKIFLLSFTVSVLVFSLLQQKIKIFLFTILFFSIYSTYRINPVYEGFGALTESSFSKTVQIINKNDNINNFRWVAYGDNILNQVLLAQGINTIGGYFYYPQHDMYKILDIGNDYSNIWNRYANVSYQLPMKNNKIDFELVNSDALVIKVDPCNEVMDKLNVKYFVFMRELDTKNLYKCLFEKEKVINNVRNFYIYKIKDNYLFK